MELLLSKLFYPLKLAGAEIGPGPSTDWGYPQQPLLCCQVQSRRVGLDLTHFFSSALPALTVVYGPRPLGEPAFV